MPQDRAPELALCRFEPTDKRGQNICKEPQPRGSYIFSTDWPVQNSRWSYWPEQGQWFVVRITGASQSGKSRRGMPVVCVHDLNKALAIAAKTAVWERQHGRAVAHVLTYTGWFDAWFDTGTRSDGQDVSPSINFTPADDCWLTPVGDYLAQHLVCLDDVAIANATETYGMLAKAGTPHAKGPDLGDLMAAKHGR